MSCSAQHCKRPQDSTCLLKSYFLICHSQTAVSVWCANVEGEELYANKGEEMRRLKLVIMKWQLSPSSPTEENIIIHWWFSVWPTFWTGTWYTAPFPLSMCQHGERFISFIHFDSLHQHPPLWSHDLHCGIFSDVTAVEGTRCGQDPSQADPEKLSDRLL